MKFTVTSTALLKRVGGYGYRVSYQPTNRRGGTVTHYSPNCGTKDQATVRLNEFIKFLESDR